MILRALALLVAVLLMPLAVVGGIVMHTVIWLAAYAIGDPDQATPNQPTP